ncbi:class I SAM-dependent methyltransferase [Paenibacillus pabuli]|uniref:class I SAM-dependent methyltransferase n=1 Tax=Paenibacillus pabuli TaxID=1472 RepID=UPI000782C586|nr:class I SAM-dependent methyltransferase [Paenibacillus pabuli]MEC0125566.1 class I SAM-dependent methyltransferase [Paenibacillus pabuli]
MPIDFHDEQNRSTYTTRSANESWISMIQENVDVSGKYVADIGCGGGIYTQALAHMGAVQVTGVDFSQEMLKGATTNCKSIQHITFSLGNAYDTHLPDHKFDLVLERALIHHLNDLDACFREAHRILKPGGTLIIQDRTPQDCIHPGNEHHLRGFFFEKFPQLIELEVNRRYDANQVQQAMEANGFRLDQTISLWETRRVYEDMESLKEDILLRTGRSLLHELSDEEMQELVEYVERKLEPVHHPIVEKDLWTVWFGVKR